MATQWSQTFALFFISVFLLLAFFETKLPDFMGLNSARHARRAGHVRSHQLNLMNEMNIDSAAPTQHELTAKEARAIGISGLDSVDPNTSAAAPKNKFSLAAAPTAFTKNSPPLVQTPRPGAASTGKIKLEAPHGKSAAKTATKDIPAAAA